MAKAADLAVSTVQRIWKAHGLAPLRWRRFKLSNDPAFAEKLHAVVGLHVAPPAHAVALSVDGKSRIQALDRTQPGLPLEKGRGATMTHDCKRHGTTTLFAALNVLTGEVFGRNMQRHRHQEFIRVLDALERDIPAGKVVHVILDHYTAHEHAKDRAWLARHPRWTFHVTPTSSSWLNAVEGFFARLSRRRLKHGVFHSVVEHNESPMPFIWRSEPDAIIAARSRGFQALEAVRWHRRERDRAGRGHGARDVDRAREQRRAGDDRDQRAQTDLRPTGGFRSPRVVIIESTKVALSAEVTRNTKLGARGARPSASDSGRYSKKAKRATATSSATSSERPSGPSSSI